MALEFAPLPFLEAIAWARARQVVLPDVYYGELQGLARSMAFSAAGMAKLDQLQAVLDSLNGALERGDSFGAWKKVATDPTGMVKLDLPAHRVENIFRTNIQGHYGRGRCEQQKRNVESHPWYLYDAINDSRTRPTHAAMDGMVARHDDTIWSRWTPPAGYQCRCRRIALTEKQAARFLAADTKRLQDPDAARARVEAQPDPGWDYNPCAEPDEGLRRAWAAKVGKVHPLLAEAAKAVGPAPPSYWDPSTLDGAWHEASFGDAPEWMKRAIRKAGQVSLIPVQEGRGAYQSANRIHMGAKDITTETGQSTWRHEFGHLMDFKSGPGNYVYRSVDFEGLMDKDAADMKRRSNVLRPSKAQDARIEALKNSYTQVRGAAMRDDARELFDQRAKSVGLDPERLDGLLRKHTLVFEGGDEQLRRGLVINAIVARDAQGLLNALEGTQIMMSGSWASREWDIALKTAYRGSDVHLSDLFSAATLKKIEGMGAHDLDYYQQNGKSFQMMEVVANITALLGDEFGDQWEIILRRMMPRMTKAWREHLETWGSE